MIDATAPVSTSIAYASRTLNEHEKRYGQIDKEAMAIMYALNGSTCTCMVDISRF